jgi:hypothetical protein
MLDFQEIANNIHVKALNEILIELNQLNNEIIQLELLLNSKKRGKINYKLNYL